MRLDRYLSLSPSVDVLTLASAPCPIAVNVSYASAILVGVLLLSSLAWVVYGNARYAGPIKTTTRWTIGAEVDLRSGSHGAQGTGRSRKKSSAQQHQHEQSGPVMAQSTSSEEHGRSAHVWVTSNGAAAESRSRAAGGESGAWTYASEEAGERTGETTTGTETGTGSGWTGTDYTTSDGEEGSSGSEAEEEDDDEDDGGRSRTRRPHDEERRVS